MTKVIIINSDQEMVDTLKTFQGFTQTTIETRTFPKLTVKSRKDGSPVNDHFKGEVTKLAKRYISEGYSYEKSIRNKIEKAGGNPDEWETSGTWNIPLEYEENGETKKSKMIFVYNGKNPTLTGKMYLQYSYQNANSKYQENVFMDDDGVILGDELENLKINFLPKKYVSKKQVEAGIEADDTLVINKIEISNIMVIKMSGKIYIRKGYELPDEK